MESDGKREFKRVPVSATAPCVFLRTVVMHNGSQSLARIVNIAEEGVFLETALSVPLETSVQMQIMVGEDACEATGAVVWLSEKGLGIRLEPNEAFRNFVRQLAGSDEEARGELLLSVQSAAIALQA